MQEPDTMLRPHLRFSWGRLHKRCQPKRRFQRGDDKVYAHSVCEFVSSGSDFRPTSTEPDVLATGRGPPAMLIRGLRRTMASDKLPPP
jgi:hypothetical protein